MADNDDDSDQFSDEEDIETLMLKNSRNFDEDAAAASSSSDDDDDDDDDDDTYEAQKSYLEMKREKEQQENVNRLSLKQDDDSDDDDIVLEAVHPPSAAKPAGRPILTLDDSSDEDETPNKRARQAPIVDPSLLKSQHVRMLAQYNCRDHTQALEQQAEYDATRHAQATRRNYFDIKPVWHNPSETLPKLPAEVRIVRTPEITQVQHLNAQLLKLLAFKRPEQYTVALRLNSHLMGEHEHVSKLTNGTLQATLYHDGVVVKATVSVPKKKMIRLTVRSPDGKNEHEFRVGEEDPFSELTEQYFQKNQVRVTLHFDGDDLRPNQTPKMMDMEDEDLIDSKLA